MHSTEFFVLLYKFASEMTAACCVTELLVQCILDYHLSFIGAVAVQQSKKASLHSTKQDNYCSNLFFSFMYHQQLDSSLSDTMYLPSLDGASNWLSALPLVLLSINQPFRMPWL